MASPLRIGKGILASGILVAFLAAGRAPAAAEVLARAAVNGASFLNSALPNGKLAPGVLFTVFGTDMGPDSLAQAGSFPLSTELAGTSVRAMVGETTLDCLMIFSSAKQIAAILPSSVPAGSGSLTVSYNGQTSDPLRIEVVPHAFGIFTTSQSGSGSGVFTNPFTNAANTLVSSANPGQLMDIWGTGIGGVGGNEAAGPLPGDMANLNVQVLVGDRPAPVVYRGRSGCCGGVDQIRFAVPEGVASCYVPVHVVVEGVASNYVTMSIAESGLYCESIGGLTAADLQTAVQTGRLHQGVLSLSRSRNPDYPVYERNDYVEAFFDSQSLQDILRSGGFPLSPHIGSCTAGPSGGVFVFISSVPAFDSGPVTLTGPPGSFTLYGGIDSTLTGIHFLSFVPDYPDDVPGIIRDGTVLTPGSYTFTASGGTYTGPLPNTNPRPFNPSITLPELVAWTHADGLSEIDRSQPLTVTWKNGVPGGWVQISGYSIFAVADRGTIGMGFTCWADAAAGSFTVPAAVVSSLPPSIDSMGQTGGGLEIGEWIFPGRFTVSGIDAGRLVAVDSISKLVRFR